MFLAGACPVSALAASGPACDNSGNRLQTLSVSVEALTAETVEHASVVAESAPATVPADAVDQVIAPLLYLTPHIATILNNVFDSPEAAIGEPPANAGVARGSSKEATAASTPQVTAPESDDGSAPATAVFRNDDIARFQRQMYRKDI